MLIVMWCVIILYFNVFHSSCQRCIDELRQRIASGGDPTKLHEPPTALTSPDLIPGTEN